MQVRDLIAVLEMMDPREEVGVRVQEPGRYPLVAVADRVNFESGGSSPRVIIQTGKPYTEED